MRKPTIKKGPASAYEAPGQLIREFNNGEGKGGLIAMATTPGGDLVINLYRLDPGIKVFVNHGPDVSKGGKVP